MNYCKYSIIPSIKDSMVCSSCGKAIEKLPYLTQIDQLFTCIKNDTYERHYIGLGLSVPMCMDCNKDISTKIAKKEKKYNFVVWVILLVFILFFVLVGHTSGEDAKYLGLPIVGAFIFYISQHDSFKKEAIDNLIQDKGKCLLDQVGDCLTKNKWRHLMKNARLRENYILESLKIDLDAVCGNGEFCLLNTITGSIVDYHDPETLKTIFKESIFVEETDNG